MRLLIKNIYTFDVYGIIKIGDKQLFICLPSHKTANFSCFYTHCTLQISQIKKNHWMFVHFVLKTIVYITEDDNLQCMKRSVHEIIIIFYWRPFWKSKTWIMWLKFATLFLEGGSGSGCTNRKWRHTSLFDVSVAFIRRCEYCKHGKYWHWCKIVTFR